MSEQGLTARITGASVISRSYQHVRARARISQRETLQHEFQLLR